MLFGLLLLIPLADSFRDFVLEQLEQCARGIQAKRMFGGIGIYCGDLFFALILDDRLYFKVDDRTRPRFEAEGMEACRPYGDTLAAIQYYEVPPGSLESADDLRAWVRDAVAVAARQRRGRHDD